MSEDWPYYTEQDRQNFRRQKPQNLTPPCSDGSTSSSGHSPSSTHTASPPRGHHHHQGPLKRGYYGSGPGRGDHDHEQHGLSPKKKRVSNYKRPPDLQQRSNGGYNNGDASPMALRTGSPLLNNSPARSPANALLPSASSNSGIVISNPQSNRAGSSLEQQRHTQEQENSNNVIMNGKSPSSDYQSDYCQSSSPPQSNIRRDFEESFTPIVSREQRARYKKEFNDNYATYRHLHAVLEKVSRRFSQLEVKLKTEPHGTETYKV